jgi:hypothetical protein
MVIISQYNILTTTLRNNHQSVLVTAEKEVSINKHNT